MIHLLRAEHTYHLTDEDDLNYDNAFIGLNQECYEIDSHIIKKYNPYMEYDLRTLIEKIKNSISNVTLDSINATLYGENLTDKQDIITRIYSQISRGNNSSNDTLNATYTIHFKNLEQNDIKIYGLESNNYTFNVKNFTYNTSNSSLYLPQKIHIGFCVELTIDFKTVYLNVYFQHYTQENIDVDFFNNISYDIKLKLVDNPQKPYVMLSDEGKFLL